MSPLTEPTRLTLAKSFTWNETVWNPSMIQTALWLDAADSSTVTTVSGAVSQWNDKSGNGRNATQSIAGSRPAVLTNALNGKQGIEFATTGRWLEVANESPFDFTTTLYAFVLCSITESSSNTLVNKGRNTFGNTGWYIEITGSNQALIGLTPGNSYSAVDSQNTALSLNTPVFLSFEINGSTVRCRRNGTTFGTTVVNKASWAASANNDSLLIGAYNTSASTADFQGLAHQILIMSSVPPLSTIEKLEGWAAHCYGLTANLPSNHPYKTVGPTP